MEMRARLHRQPPGRARVGPGSRDLGIPGEHAHPTGRRHWVIHGVEHSFPHGLPDDPFAAAGHSPCSPWSGASSSSTTLPSRATRARRRRGWASATRPPIASGGRTRSSPRCGTRRWCRRAALPRPARHPRARWDRGAGFHRGEIVATLRKARCAPAARHLARLDRRVEGDAARMRGPGGSTSCSPGMPATRRPKALPRRPRNSWPRAGRRLDLPPTRAEYQSPTRGRCPTGEEARAPRTRCAAAGGCGRRTGRPRRGNRGDGHRRRRGGARGDRLAGRRADDLPGAMSNNRLPRPCHQRRAPLRRLQHLPRKRRG